MVGKKQFYPYLEFTEHHKSLEHPIAIYADFESVCKSVDHCESYPDISSTDVKSIHQCSGFSYTVVSPHFPQETVTYAGKNAGIKFLESVLEQEIKINDWKKENEKKNHDLSDDEEKQYQEENQCHICKDRILSSDQDPTSTRVKVLAEIEDLLLINKLPTDKIPSLKLVKRQQRIISLELHPDKNLDASDEEKNAKLEEIQVFLKANNELRDLLIEKEIIIAEEENIDFDELDELTEEEIERITKKGWKVRDHCHCPC